MGILADDEGKELASEFEAAANNPKDTDFAFLKQREASGFANFGHDPERAAELRQAELERIEASLQDAIEDDDYSPWSRELQAEHDAAMRDLDEDDDNGY